jgi:hypothetical protein
MKRALTVAAVAAVCALTARAGEWRGYLMDAVCAKEIAHGKAPGHKLKCALTQSNAGYGVLTIDGKFLRFDSSGNAKALEALKETSKERNLTVKITGTTDGEVILVEGLTLH